MLYTNTDQYLKENSMQVALQDGLLRQVVLVE